MMNYDKNKFSECISNIIKNIHYTSSCPSFYKIILKKESTSDNNCSNSFIYFLLSEIFYKDNKEIADNLKTFSETGHIIIGNYTKDVAETKISSANECAVENGVALKISLRRGENDAIKKS